MPDLESMTLDQQLAVRAARDRLLREFDATPGEPTVDAVLDAGWDHMDQSARLKAHMPLLAEHASRRCCSPVGRGRTGCRSRPAPRHPRGASLEQARAMRDDMRARVDTPADEMGIPAQQ